MAMGVQVAVGAAMAGLMMAVSPALGQTQTPSPPSAGQDIQIPPSVLAEIREAPFSQVFSVGDEVAFGIKDQDYTPAEPTIGVFSLWADVPAWERLQMVMKYCVQNTDMAQASASLVEVKLLDGETPVAVINQVVESSHAQLSQVQPPRTSNVGTSLYYSPFYDPYYSSPFSFGVSYSPTVQLPAVDCSAGVSRFDLMPVKADLAQLPDTTLTMRLLFSDGNTEYWQLGSGTVRAIKQLPSVSQ